MELHYFLLFVFFTSYIFFRLKYRNKRLGFLGFIFLFSIMLVFSTFRDLNVGNDTLNYANYYQDIVDFSVGDDLLLISRFEPGFAIFNFVLSIFSNDFEFLLAVVTFVYIFLLFRFVNIYAKNKYVTVIVFFLFGIFYIVFNLLRVCLAMAFVLYAFDFLVKSQKRKYLIFVLLAATFHYSALFMLILLAIPKVDLFNYKFNLRREVFILVFIVVGILAIPYILDLMPYYAHYYYESIYSEGDIRLASVGNLLIRLIIIGVLLLFKYNKKVKNTGELQDPKDIITVRANSYLASLFALDLLLSVLCLEFNMFDRLELFLRPFMILYITNILCAQVKYRWLIAIFLIVILMTYQILGFVYRPEWSGIFPYRLSF